MFEIGLSTTGKTVDEKLFEVYKSGGIKHMEISLPNDDTYINANYAKIKEYSMTYDINLWSFHLPFKPFNILDISSSDANLRKKSVEYTAELIKKAADIGIDKYIVHSGGITKRQNPEEVSQRLKYACESYSSLAEIAHRCGGVVAVENLPPVCAGKDIQEIEILLNSDERLGLCFDTNHLLGGEKGADFIRHFRDRIITVHISDYDFVNERHWLPGEGSVDWQSIYKALCDIDYKGVWLYETSFTSKPTLIRERDLTCADFVRNAMEIFDGREITVIPGKKTVNEH